MSYLIDTNVLSELKRKAPDQGVLEWFAQRSSSMMYLSVLTLGEIRKGIEGVNDLRRQQVLSDWLEFDLQQFFSGRILSVDAAVADRWGRMVAAAGRPLPVVDSLLAATALEHDLVLVTRNTQDFAHTPVQLYNPWSGRSI